MRYSAGRRARGLTPSLAVVLLAAAAVSCSHMGAADPLHEMGLQCRAAAGCALPHLHVHGDRVVMGSAGDCCASAGSDAQETHSDRGGWLPHRLAAPLPPSAVVTPPLRTVSRRPPADNFAEADTLGHFPHTVHVLC